MMDGPAEAVLIVAIKQILVAIKQINVQNSLLTMSFIVINSSLTGGDLCISPTF